MKKVCTFFLVIVCVLCLVACSTETQYKVKFAANYEIANDLKETYSAGEKVTIQLPTITDHYYVLYVNGVKQNPDESVSDDWTFTYYTFTMPSEDVLIEIEDRWVDIPDGNSNEIKQDACQHVWERTENYNEYTAMDKCVKCGNTRKYTDSDNITHSGYETGFKLLRYNWDGYGIGTKEINACDLGYAIIDCLSKLEETGEIIPKISDDPVDETTGVLPITRGTVWIECGTVGLFRLNPEMNEICKVQTHLGEGVSLKMTETLEELLTQAWYYYPNDYWSGKYENGKVTLNQIFKSDSVIDSVRIESITVENKDSADNSISLILVANQNVSTRISLFCSNGGDVLGKGDSKDVQLLANKEHQVELEFGGLYANWTYYLSIKIDNTRVNLTISPMSEE